MRRCSRLVSRTPRWTSAVVLLLLAAAPGLALAAGYQRAEAGATASEAAVPMMIWFPCEGATTSSQLGPYVVDADPDCDIVGESLPMIAISHGQGGSFLGHHDTAVALANAGFVVVSVSHPGDTFSDESRAQSVSIFETRPRDISRALTYLLSEWPHRQRLDAQSIGVFGFSRGGYTALSLIGATPSVSASGSRFCASWWSFVHSLCRQLDASDARIVPQADSRVRAAVVVDPLNLFDDAGLGAVTAPVQLWASELGGDGVELSHVEAIRSALPTPPEYRIARGGGHFAFLAPCPPALMDSAPRICEDPESFDRAALHRTMNAEVVSFFARHLKTASGDASATGAVATPEPQRPD